MSNASRSESKCKRLKNCGPGDLRTYSNVLLPTYSFISETGKLEDGLCFEMFLRTSLLEISRCENPTGKFWLHWRIVGELAIFDSTASKAENASSIRQINWYSLPMEEMYRNDRFNRVWKQKWWVRWNRGNHVDERINLPLEPGFIGIVGSGDFVENGLRYSSD